MATPVHRIAGSSRSSLFGVIDPSRQGVLRSQVDEVAALVGLTDREMAYTFNMTPR